VGGKRRTKSVAPGLLGRRSRTGPPSWLTAGTCCGPLVCPGIICRFGRLRRGCAGAGAGAGAGGAAARCWRCVARAFLVTFGRKSLPKERKDSQRESSERVASLSAPGEWRPAMEREAKKVAWEKTVFVSICRGRSAGLLTPQRTLHANAARLNKTMSTPESLFTLENASPAALQSAQEHANAATRIKAEGTMFFQVCESRFCCGAPMICRTHHLL
jgi:hypothetical protein